MAAVGVDDPANPFNNSARPQSYTPSLQEEWVWGQDLIRGTVVPDPSEPHVDRSQGVNLGGWLITEPFIVPALYEKYQNATPPAVDEWTLSEAMINDTSSGGGLKQLEEHYKTFIVSSRPSNSRALTLYLPRRQSKISRRSRAPV